jgi:hypothetical protein
MFSVRVDLFRRELGEREALGGLGFQMRRLHSGGFTSGADRTTA